MRASWVVLVLLVAACQRPVEVRSHAATPSAAEASVAPKAPEAPSAHVVEPATPSARADAPRGISRERFYHLAEGSEILPLTFLRALEGPEGTDSFMAPDNLARYGMLADAASSENPQGLPVGMTLGATSNQGLRGFLVVGFNCAACHVGELQAESRSIRLVGAPNMLDIKRFTRDIALALKALKRPSAALAFFVRLHKLMDQAKGIEQGASGGPLRRSLIDGVGDETLEIYRMLPPLSEMRKAGTLSRAIAAEVERVVRAEFRAAEVASTAEIAGSQLGLAQSRDGDATGSTALHLQTISNDRASTLSSDFLSSALVAQLGEESARVEFLKDTPRGDTIASMATFVTDFTLTVRWLAQRLRLLRQVYAVDQYAENTQAGPGRVDAFGTARNLMFGPTVAAKTDAPVSFPHLWGFMQNRWLHWDANSTSVLERNIGQAIGLGAIVDPKTFESSVLVRNLHELETFARAIPAPAWPFSPPDGADAAEGKALFLAQCAECHAEPQRKPGEQEGVDVGTDMKRVQSFNRAVGRLSFSDALAAVLSKAKQRAFAREHVEASEQAAWEPTPSLWRSTKGYANRSLAGIWASAPYLHNGSVASLEQLLLPPRQRLKRFRLGSRRYDVSRVGFVTDEGPFEFDTSQPGNENRGHDYGTGLDELKRKQMVAYLKTL